MTAVLFDYPKHTNFGRVLPKNKIYERGRPSAAVKRLFVQQVEQVIWQYKLAPETVKLRSSRAVPEIQIFSIALKGDELSHEVLRCIDQAIPLPIIFELRCERKLKPIAAYKQPGDVVVSKRIISEYFDGDWVSVDTPRKPLPMVLDLEALYGHLLMPLMPYPARPGEDLQQRVTRMEQIRFLQRELERCVTRLHKEKQFNRKVAINAELRDLNQELEGLIR